MSTPCPLASADGLWRQNFTWELSAGSSPARALRPARDRRLESKCWGKVQSSLTGKRPALMWVSGLR